MQLENIYKSTRFATANVPNSFRDSFFSSGESGWNCVYQSSEHLQFIIEKGSLFQKSFFFFLKISQQNIASLGNNSSRRRAGSDSGVQIPPRHSQDRRISWTFARWPWVRGKAVSDFPQNLWESVIYIHQMLGFGGFSFFFLQSMKFTALGWSSAQLLWGLCDLQDATKATTQ